MKLVIDILAGIVAGAITYPLAAPESFAACATRAFGGMQHLRAPKDFHFPRYSGELSMLYTIPPKGD
jgi:hypothetical protein